MIKNKIKKMFAKIIIGGMVSLSIILPSTNALANSQKTVIIEAGHGGKDVGAIAIDGSYEKDRTLTLANKIANHLQTEGIKVVFTRLSDNYKHPSQIVREVNNVEGDFVLNVHYNANENREALGVETYYSNPNISGTEKYNNLGEKIGEDMTKNMSSTLNTANRGNKPSPFYNRRMNKPSILVEAGFISNPIENEKIYAYQEELAKSIATSIINNLKGER